MSVCIRNVVVVIVIIVVVRARRELYTLTERWNQIYECIWTQQHEKKRRKMTTTTTTKTTTAQKQSKNVKIHQQIFGGFFFCTNDQIAAKVDGVFEQKIVWSSFFSQFFFSLLSISFTSSLQLRFCNATLFAFLFRSFSLLFLSIFIRPISKWNRLCTRFDVRRQQDKRKYRDIEHRDDEENEKKKSSTSTNILTKYKKKAYFWFETYIYWRIARSSNKNDLNFCV